MPSPPSSRHRAAVAASAAALLVTLAFPSVAAADATTNVETESDILLETSTADTAATTIDPKSEHASLADIVSFVQTEVPAEFEFGSEFMGGGMTEEEMTSKAKTLWDSAIAFEWERCSKAEEKSSSGTGGRCTFLVCKKADGEGGEEGGKSGYARRTTLTSAVERALAVSTGGLITERAKEEAVAIASTFRSVYNGGENDWYCGEGRMEASVAALLSCAKEDGGDGSQCTVTPVVMEMTMTPGMVDRMNMALDKTYSGEEGGGKFPIVDLTLCSGAVGVSDREALAAMAAVQDGKIEKLDLKGLDVAIEFIEYITSAPDTFKDEMRFKKNGGGDTNGGGVKNSKRGDFWDDVFSHVKFCDAVYEKRIMWSLFDIVSPPGEDEVVGEVILALTFDESSTPTSVDKKCVVALLGALASWSKVCSVDVRPKLTVSNLQEQWLIQSGIQEERPWFDVGLDGTGQVVAVSDTGIDTDNCFFWDAVNGDPTSIRNDNRRKVVQYRPFVDNVDQQYGHGTHVTATVAGRRAVDGINESTGPADGTAQGAKIAFIDIGDRTGALSIPSTSDLLSTGRAGAAGTANPASIHSGSWGAPGINFYSPQAMMFDNFMFENDDLLVNMAAGNSGRSDAPGTVTSPATFKNGIAVGSSHSFGDNLAPTLLGPAFLSDFSSRGPTADGRMKPEVIAPGQNLVSAGALPFRTGECDTSGVPRVGGAADGLLSLAGTSMATPAVSGTAAMIRQYFVEGWYPDGAKGSGDPISPSGALVKAVILNGAQTDMRGVDNSGCVTPVAPYDNNIGFGRVSLMYALYIEGKTEVQARVWDRQTIADGVEQEFDVTIDRSNGCTFSDLSVTLVWMERGSVSGCTRCLLNDLDLRLTKDGGDGTIYYPNGLGGRDTTNNVERVVLRNVTDGDSYTLHVTATNLDGPSQKYAVVATGCFGGVNNALDASDNVFGSSESSMVTDRPTCQFSQPVQGGAPSHAGVLAVAVIVSLSFFLCLIGLFRRSLRKGQTQL